MDIKSKLQIDLRDIFDEEELLRFNHETKNNIQPNTPKSIMTKQKLKQLIIQLIKTKLKQLKESYTLKAIDWLEEEINDTKRDISFLSQSLSLSLSSNQIEQVIKENEELKCIHNFLDEYATIKLNTFATSKINQINALYQSSKVLSMSEIKKLANEINSTNEIENHQLDHFINFSEDCVKSIETESFNILKLEEQIGVENTLSVISCFVFTFYNLYSVINYNKFENFIHMITKGYNRGNPYHNDLHAADVTQTSMIYVNKTSLNKIFKLNELDMCALFISCIVHDYKHPGYTNGLLINIGNPLAIRYNDISVLENYHISQTFKLIGSNEKVNVFSKLTYEDYKTIRKRMVGIVIATDMKFHFKQFGYLKDTIKQYNITQGKNRKKILEGVECPFMVQQEFLEIIVHACDISNPTKTYDLYSYWSTKVVEEFWRQGDKEKQLNLKVSMNCDRLATTQAQCQIGFIEGIMTPFFLSFVEIFPEVGFLIENMQKNKEIYRKIREKETNTLIPQDLSENI